MKTSILIGALAAAFVLPTAYATGPNGQVLIASATTQPALSRAQVKQEARTAELTGEIPRGEASWRDGAQYAPSNISRAEVKAQTRVAEARGLIPRGDQDLIAVSAQPRTSEVSRAEVKAETRYAEAHNQIARGESNNGM